MNRLIPTLIFACIAVFSQGQNTNISGIINAYELVSGIAGSDLTVTSATGFSVGDQVLLIQMQGATIDETNSAAFGDITAYGTAGNYEMTSICAIPNGTTIILNSIQRTYDATGIVQLVNVPQYVDATVTGTLTAAPWDGATGGILAFKCSGTLTMNDNINVEGLGFRGAAVTTSAYACAWFTDVTNYFYNITTGQGALKGEGAALYIPLKTGGRGAQANGGGGSNDHNGGGGGGGNAAAGGLGGERIRPSTFTCRCNAPGVGGKPLTYSNANNQIFLGGGGGAGHENNPATATPGANGAGIVIISANTIDGNSQSINADGSSVTANSVDGAGGAGGGGTVLLAATTFAGALTVNTSGGAGGDVSNIGPSNCNGPGGGGGGGILWVNQGSIPAGVTYNSNGGSNGTTVATTQGNCTLNGANNATPGSAGASLTNLSIPETSCNVSPVLESLAICDGDSAFLENTWQTIAGVYNDTVTSSCCDTIYVTTLTIRSIDSIQTAASICQGDSVFLDGNWQTTTGIYHDSYSNIAGCDSIIETTLAVHPSYNVSNTATICDNDSIFLEGAWQTSAGVYTDSYITASNCDSSIQTTLSMNPSYNSNGTATICANDSVFLAGTWQNTGGIYVDASLTVNGCDSLISTTLTVNPNYSISAAATICDNDSIFLAGAWQTSAGTYADSYTSTLGCDSIVQTTVSLSSASTNTATVSICDNDSIFLGGAWQNTAGTYVDLLQNSLGCDSAVTTILTVDPTYSGTNSVSVTYPDSAFLGGAWQTENGLFIDSFTTSNGCDSSVTTTLTVLVGIGENTFKRVEVSVYPNPFTNSTTIDFSAHSRSSAQFTMFNTTGKIVRQKPIPAGGKATILRGDLGPGLYYFELDFANGNKGAGKLTIR